MSVRPARTLSPCAPGGLRARRPVGGELPETPVQLRLLSYGCLFGESRVGNVCQRCGRVERTLSKQMCGPDPGGWKWDPMSAGSNCVRSTEGCRAPAPGGIRWAPEPSCVWSSHTLRLGALLASEAGAAPAPAREGTRPFRTSKRYGLAAGSAPSLNQASGDSPPEATRRTGSSS